MPFNGIMVAQGKTEERRFMRKICCLTSNGRDDPYNDTCRFELAALQGQLRENVFRNADNFVQ